MAYHRFDLFADRVQTNESLAFEIKRCTFSDDGSHAGHGAYPLGELIGSWFLDIRRLMVGFNPAVATLTRALLIAFSTCGAPALLAGLPTGAAGAAANPELPNLHAVFAALDDGTPAVNAAAVFMQAAMADGIDVQPLPGNPSSMGDATTRSWHPLVLSW